MINQIPRALTDLRDRIEAALNEALPEGTFSIQTASRTVLLSPGKRLRPILTMLACRAVGGEDEVALPIAIASELAHAASLIHDDIMDHSSFRRGQPTVSTVEGEALAIISGDYLLIKFYELLAEGKALSPEARIEIIRTVSIAGLECCQGQELDVKYSALEKITLEQYLTMVRLKCASLFGAAAAIGAIAGHATHDQVEHFNHFGYDIGMAFQIRDDILDIYGKTGSLGKPTYADVLQDRKNLILVLAREELSGAELGHFETLTHRVKMDSVHVSSGNDGAAATHDNQETFSELLALLNRTTARQRAEALVIEYLNNAGTQLDGLGETGQPITGQHPELFSILQYLQNNR